jgi:hypothetical protein
MKTIISRFNVNYFFTVPVETQIIWLWFGFFVLSLGVTVILFFYFKSKAKTIKPYQSYGNNFFWPNLIITIIGIILILCRVEKLIVLSWRFWVYLDLLLLAMFNGWYFMIKRDQLDDEIIRFYNTKRKEKWLKK